MKVAVIGSGYVGLVSGACFSEFGINVVCVDKDHNKINNLQKNIMPIYEPGLQDLVKTNQDEGRLSFTTDIKDALIDVQAVFIAVGTPPTIGTGRRGEGHADLSYVYEAAKEIATHLDHYAVIITKSTVPVGTAAEIKKIVSETNPSLDFDVCSNPEFLREGSAINDFMRPDRVIVGLETERAEKIMRRLYRPLFLRETPMIVTNPETSDLSKYAANAFLATKITFINEIANLAEKCNADVQTVAKAMGLDGRIGSKFLHAGPGYGGSCFPKDTLALTKIGEDYDARQHLVETVVDVNTNRKKEMGHRIVSHFNGDLSGKTVAVLGLTFKPNTDDMREAPSIDIIPILQEAGASIRAFDPEGMKEASSLLPSTVRYTKDAYDCVTGADCVVIITEWNQFRLLDLDHVKTLMKEPLIFDLRNIYKPEEAIEAGITYFSIGRGISTETETTETTKSKVA